MAFSVRVYITLEIIDFGYPFNANLRSRVSNNSLDLPSLLVGRRRDLLIRVAAADLCLTSWCEA